MEMGKFFRRAALGAGLVLAGTASFKVVDKAMDASAVAGSEVAGKKTFRELIQLQSELREEEEDLERALGIREHELRMALKFKENTEGLELAVTKLREDLAAVRQRLDEVREEIGKTKVR